MADRRPLVSFTNGDYDDPPASDATEFRESARQLEHLQASLQRLRERARAAEATSLHHFFEDAPRLSRRRRHRSIGNESSGMSDIEDGRSSRTAKRRKLRHSSPAPTQTYKYGHYGQVESGRLKLVLKGCDGGVHTEGRGTVTYTPANILKHDKSVYCTQRDQCNIILRHHDDTSFSLEKFFVVAPESGFTAPVEEGIVHVAMNYEDLQPYLEDFWIRPRPPRLPSPPVRSTHVERLTLLESLQDPEINRVLTRSPNRHAPFAQDDRSPTPPTPDDDYAQESWERSAGDSLWRVPLEPMRRSGFQSREETPSFDDQSDSESNDCRPRARLSFEEITWPEDPTPGPILADRNSRDRHVRMMDGQGYGRARRHRRMHSELRHGPMQDHIAGDFDSGRSRVTTASFRISQGRNNVAIKFDPPVAGRFILLKLQSDRPGKNIDIQTVIACGYAGPRFFPAVECR